MDKFGNIKLTSLASLEREKPGKRAIAHREKVFSKFLKYPFNIGTAQPTSS